MAKREKAKITGSVGGAAVYSQIMIECTAEAKSKAEAKRERTNCGGRRRAGNKQSVRFRQQTDGTGSQTPRGDYGHLSLKHHASMSGNDGTQSWKQNFAGSLLGVVVIRETRHKRTEKNLDIRHVHK